MLDWLEKRFRDYAIPRLINIVVCANVFFWFFIGTQREGLERLVLDRRLVAAGEVWRLVTHLLIPPATNPLWLFFALYLLWLYGTALEKEWGTFRFNVFYFTGALLTTIAGLLFEVPTASGAMYLNATVFFAFATLFPNFELLLFFLLPVKVKWLAWLLGAGFLLQFIEGAGAERAVIVVSLANYLIFFWRPFFDSWWYRSRRERFRRSVASPADVFHRCGSCQRSEKDDATLEFRVCPDCTGGKEYCLEHLDSHAHS